MRKRNIVYAGTIGLFLAAGTLRATNDSPNQTSCSLHCIPETNTSYIDAAGTAHVTRVVPVPPTISPLAQKFVARRIQDIPGAGSALNYWGDQQRAAKLAQTMYPVHLGRTVIAGVPVKTVTPLTMPAQNRTRVLIDLHGGGFVGDGGSWQESIPMGYFTQTKVIAVLYRLAPKYPFPAAVNDVVAVYKQLLKTYKAQDMAMYGTSAGAMLTPEVCVRLRQLGLPLPGALGIFGGQGDFTTAAKADSRSLFTQDGLAGHLNTPATDGALVEYMGSADPKNPELSPMFADLHHFPPTLFVTSGRDMMLSGTIILHRAFLRAGNDARLVVFEGLPHGFWYDPYLPESKEADRMMASFFEKKLDLMGKYKEPYIW
jgi:epsilon-lactone hydrolase